MGKIFLSIFILFSVSTFAMGPCQNAVLGNPLQTQGFLEVVRPRLFTDLEAQQIIRQLVAATGQPKGDFHIYEQFDRLSMAIGYPAANRIREFVRSMILEVENTLIPFPENTTHQISPMQTFVRWNITASAVNDQPHIDETAITIIKREHMPHLIPGTKIYQNGVVHTADSSKTLIFNGRYRRPQLASNGFQFWYQTPQGVLHGASPSSGVWDLGIFISLR